MTSSDHDLARLFDAQYCDFTEDLPLWSALARDHGSPLIELGCGTGRVLLNLAHAGHEVFGVDSNPAMLERAAARLDRESASRVTLRQEDLKHFSIPRRFRLAIAPLNVLAELNDSDIMQSLATVRRHLEPRGAIAMDLPNPAQSLLDPADEDEPLDYFEDPETGNPIQVSARQRMNPGNKAVAVSWFYDELLPDGLVSRHRFEATYHLRSPDLLIPLLAEAGFADVGLYGDYRFGDYDDSSKRLIAVAVAV